MSSHSLRFLMKHQNAFHPSNCEEVIKMQNLTCNFWSSIFNKNVWTLKRSTVKNFFLGEDLSTTRFFKLSIFDSLKSFKKSEKFECHARAIFLLTSSQWLRPKIGASVVSEHPSLSWSRPFCPETREEQNSSFFENNSLQLEEEKMHQTMITAETDHF